MVSASAFAVVAVDADDEDVDTVHAAHPGSATLPPTYAQRFYGPPRAGRSNGSRTRRRRRRQHRSPGCRFARPVDGCDLSTPACECGWSCCRTNSCPVLLGDPACAAVLVAVVGMKMSLIIIV